MAIIGILAAIVLPVYNEVKLAAKKAKDMSNLKRIADAWRECFVNRGRQKSSWTPMDFVFDLAGQNRIDLSDMVLNDPYAYISPGDKYASKVQRDTLTYWGTLNRVDLEGKGKYYSGPGIAPYGDAFSYVVGINSYAFKVLSYCLVTGLSPRVPLDIAILGFTRGLCEDGTWDEKTGLYGSKGGYVVYCDGHVTWFDGSQPAKFLKWDRSGYTSNILDVVSILGINGVCYIGCCTGTPNNTFTNKNGSPVVLGINARAQYIKENYFR
jgi:prepilin-type processing-associated H-X9-DG protein